VMWGCLIEDIDNGVSAASNTASSLKDF